MKRYILTDGNNYKKLLKNINNNDNNDNIQSGGDCNVNIQSGGGGEFNEKHNFPYPEYDTKAKRLKKLAELKKKLKAKHCLWLVLV